MLLSQCIATDDHGQHIIRDAPVINTPDTCQAQLCTLIFYDGALEDEVAKNYPPDGFEINPFYGTWGIDADHNTSIANVIGDSCVELKSTLVNTQLWQATSTPVAGGQPYKIKAIVQVDTVTAGNNVEIGVSWRDDSDSHLSWSTVYGPAVAPGAGTWYELSGVIESPANARGVRVYAQKSATAMTMYVDYLALKEMPVCFHAYQDASQSLPSHAWTKIHFNQETYDYGSVYENTTTYRFIAPSDGVYAFSAAVRPNIATANITSIIELWKNTITPIAAGDYDLTQANIRAPVLQVSAPALFLNRGDVVEVFVFHNNSPSISTTGNGYENYFMGARVE